MLAQRFTQQSARRVFAHHHLRSSSSSSIILHRLPKFAAPATLTARTNLPIQTRPIATETIPANPPPDTSLLAAQRLRRPVSPHLSIYRPQITWYLSALNRITGSLLSGGFYIFGAAYLAAPLFGWHLESAALAASFGSLPVAVKVGVKFAVALPFTFHAFNGVRHLVWDTGRELGNRQVQVTGWAVVGASVVGSGVLAVV